MSGCQSVRVGLSDKQVQQEKEEEEDRQVEGWTGESS